jgi:death on curing protein
MNPEFLDAEDVIEIHRRQLEEFGGLNGVRDAALLDSALAQPTAAFGGRFLHEDLFAMAAAHLFHIVANHPFIDGNKRTGLVAALTFLDINGHPIDQSGPLLYDATMAVAAGRLGKEGVADLLRSLAVS